MCQHTSGISFRKATASGNNQSGPNCVEVGVFFKAQQSGPAGHCVEVAFTKAARSHPVGECVEVAYAKAASSNPSGNCVEPGQATVDEHAECTPETCRTPGIEPGDVVVRDSKLGEDSPLAVFTLPEWVELAAAVAAGAPYAAVQSGPDGATITDPRSGVVLNYTVAEWDAFTDGCQKGEFAYQPLTPVPA